MKIFACKAILNKESTSVLSSDWATSKRSVLQYSKDHMEVAGITISFSEIKSAVICIVPSAFFFSSCILTVVMEDGATHHLGVRYSSFWKKEFPFPVERSKSKVSLLWQRRLIVLGFIGVLVWYFIKRSY